MHTGDKITNRLRRAALLGRLSGQELDAIHRAANAIEAAVGGDYLPMAQLIVRDRLIDEDGLEVMRVLSQATGRDDA